MSSRLRLMNDWILVKMDPDSDKTLSGSLFRPENAYETALCTGEVKAVGPGPLARKNEDVYLDKRIPVGVEPGEGVVFNRVVAKLTKTAESLHQFVLEEDEALLRPNDIMLVYDRKEKPRFE
jgi:co-chaperonin GroES (HSP10)